MAGHRSPHGSRAPRRAAGPARHHAADRPAPSAPSLRNTVVATAAAVGAVATGTFTALLPTPGDATTEAGAETLDGALLSSSAALVELPTELPTETTAVLSPVSYDGTDTADAAAIADLALLDKAAVMAEELAAQRAEEQRIAAERAELDALIAEGGVDGWIAEALDVMGLPQSLAPAVKKIIMAESGGNPRAINDWDSNARAGTPSQGLMQTIPSTFAHYVHPDLAGESITHPIANITAGVRYMIDTYGMDTLEAGGRTNSAGSYVGY
ncbi:transglycosylase SLT domain-containing protein [Pseudonocardia sp.]|uniref:transglycosylase SLT domain-containing protein n=1 Tax=Pseudonocardia sp. TaxID=60912 RepID=UPI00263945FD|nr:transglycosylase SLT domain-containing protein [Pseudonocardia sp.]